MHIYTTNISYINIIYSDVTGYPKRYPGYPWHYPGYPGNPKIYASV